MTTFICNIFSFSEVNFCHKVTLGKNWTNPVYLSWLHCGRVDDVRDPLWKLWRTKKWFIINLLNLIMTRNFVFGPNALHEMNFISKTQNTLPFLDICFKFNRWNCRQLKKWSFHGVLFCKSRISKMASIRRNKNKKPTPHFWDL